LGDDVGDERYTSIAQRRHHAGGVVAPDCAGVLAPSLHQRGAGLGRHWTTCTDGGNRHAWRVAIDPAEGVGRQTAHGSTWGAAQLDEGAGLFQVHESVASAVCNLRHSDSAVLVADAVAVEGPLGAAGADVDAATGVDRVVFVLAAATTGSGRR